jgi:hypothetical protein
MSNEDQGAAVSNRRYWSLLDITPQWNWSDDIEPPPPDWWLGDTPDPAWQAPEFDFGEGRALSLDSTDPFPPDDLPVFRWD